MNDFISVYDALPALNCLVEYKDTHNNIRTTRIIMDREKHFLNWINNAVSSAPWPKQVVSWRYVEADKTLREKEVKNWLESLP